MDKRNRHYESRSQTAKPTQKTITPEAQARKALQKARALRVIRRAKALLAKR